MIRILVIALLLAFAPAPLAAADAELIMFEQPGCPFCAKWNREIGPIYPKSDIGAKAPLRRVQISDKKAYGVTLNGPVIFTPTFVISVAGRETGRIEGYASDEFFWGLLAQRTTDIPAPTTPASTPALTTTPAPASEPSAPAGP